MSLIDCPDCGLPAGIVDCFALNGTSGPAEHVKAHCPVLIAAGARGLAEAFERVRPARPMSGRRNQGPDRRDSPCSRSTASPRWPVPESRLMSRA